MAYDGPSALEAFGAEQPRRRAARHRHAAAWTATRWRAPCAPASPSAAPALVALTGWGQEEDRRRAREAGFDHHLVKPADIDRLRDLLSSVAR